MTYVMMPLVDELIQLTLQHEDSIAEDGDEHDTLVTNRSLRDDCLQCVR